MYDEQNSPGASGDVTGYEAAGVDSTLRGYLDLDRVSARAEFHDDPDLSESWLADGWEPLLRSWIEEAARAGIAEPSAMQLATVKLTDRGPRPASRTVLCLGLSSEGVTFYTDRGSQKAQQLDEVPYASVTFAWPALGRQVHLSGPVRQIPPEMTAAHWYSRPRTVQVGGWSSQQSRPIASRAELERAHAEITARFAGLDQLPVQPNWGGYQVRTEQVEFWQRRRRRLHNRIRVELDGVDMSAVKVTRLQP